MSIFGKKKHIDEQHVASGRSPRKKIMMDIMPSEGRRRLERGVESFVRKEHRESSQRESAGHTVSEIVGAGHHTLRRAGKSLFSLCYAVLSYLWDLTRWMWQKIRRTVTRSAGAEIDGFSGVTVAPRRNRKPLILASIVLTGLVGWLVLNQVSYITLKITPRQQAAAVDHIFSGAKAGSADFPVEVISFQREKELTGPTTGSSMVKDKARGKVVVYNAYSSEAQLLVRRTRFETPDGKIYRVPEAVTVPGAKIQDGKIVPSSLEIEVEADQAGEEYNIGLTDFTIPGFKGTARFAKFYGRSLTPMEGGFTGTRRTASKSDVDVLVSELSARLKEEIMQEYARQLPDGFMVLDGGRDVSLGEPSVHPAIGAAGDTVSVKMAGYFKGIIIRRSDLSVALAHVSSADATGKVEVANLPGLKMEVTSRDFEKGTLALRVTGNAALVWPIDEEGIKREFMSGKKSMAEIFDSYGNIERAEMVFSPSWWRFMPNSADRIKIERVLTL